MEKALLLLAFAAGCALCSTALARDRVGSGSGIGGRGSVTPFGADSFTPQRRAQPRKEPSAASGGSAEHKEPNKEVKDPKMPAPKKTTSEK